MNDVSILIKVRLLLSPGGLGDTILEVPLRDNTRKLLINFDNHLPRHQGLHRRSPKNVVLVWVRAGHKLVLYGTLPLAEQTS